MAATQHKLGDALQSLLHSARASGSGSHPSPLVVVAAGAVAAAALCLLLSFLFNNKASTAAAKATKPVPQPKGHPVIDNTVEVLGNLDRFLDWILDCTRKPELGGEDGLGERVSKEREGGWAWCCCDRSICVDGSIGCPGVMGGGRRYPIRSDQPTIMDTH